MKTINLELSKRLAPYLEDIETEYGIVHFIDDCGNDMGTNITKDKTINTKFSAYNPILYKTLTLEEAIELLPSVKYDRGFEYSLTITKSEDYYWINYDKLEIGLYETIYEKTLLGAIEKMISYLLDNGLLEKSK